MPAHARLSPSGAHRWMACPGSVALEEAMGAPDEGSVHAEEGTAAHELAQWVLSDETKNCADFIGMATGNKWVVTPDMARDVQVYVDTVRDYAKDNLLLVEHRVDFSEVINVPESFGTADAIILTSDGRELQVHDLKFGRGVQVFAEENEQLMIYALGALFEFALTHDFERVRLVIHQPRLNHLSEWDCSVDELVAFSKKLKIQAAKVALLFTRVVTKDDLNPGEKQCRWCKAAAVCPAIADAVTEATGLDFEDLTLLKDVTPFVPTTADRLAEKMKAIGIIEIFCKAVRAEVERQLLAGNQVSGYKIVQGKQGNRTWTDEQGVEAVFKALRLRSQDMYHYKLISPTDAEKLFSKTPRKWKRIEQYITRTPGKLSVAPDSDKRPAIAPGDVRGTFEDISNEALF